MDSFCHKIILKSREYYDFNNTYRLNLNSLSTFLVSKIISQNQAKSLIFSIQEQGSESFIFTKMTYFKPPYVYFEKFNPSLEDFEYFVFDVGGTILDDKKMLQFQNIKTINELAKLGKKIILATSGSFFNFENYFEKINLNMPIICANGAMIYDNNNFELTYGLEIQKYIAYKIMNKCKELELAYYIFHDKGMAGIDVQNSSAYKQNKEATGMKKESWVLNPEPNFFDDKKIYKVFVTFESNQNQKVNKLVLFCKQFNELHAVQTHSNFIDIGIKCSKGNALLKLQVDLNKTVVFGDSDNDLSLIELASLSFSHINARPEVLEKVSYISDKTNNDGWINEIVNDLFSE
ncbi:HAD-IIB family hydrolase [Mycoplasmopsis bovis]|uniref:HAD-IIB family hydrolase n=1 Tax=Mycoplasmopsis bovis TaxID=28903 RepID=UPI001151E457|nr:HAD-IIB family hydrolase [Mycoplasmopsis bovis]TQF60137.1 HAD family hydrolase [Mycoplasmopsis bovis]